MQIRRGTKQEFYKIIDFIDYVFSIEFLKLYANLYEETDESMHNLINMWDDDMIVGSVLSFPRVLSVNGTELSLHGIGSVACHPRYRGKGIMSRLLSFNNDEMKNAGVKLSYLDGRRSRYNHFGYENGGNMYCVTMSKIALKASGYSKKGYSFVPFTLEDTELLKKMHELYSAKPIHYVYTPEQFFLRLVIPLDPRSVPLAVYNEKGDLLGYVAVHFSDDSVDFREICLYDDSLIPDVAFEFCTINDCKFSACFYEYQMKYFLPIADVGSLVKTSTCGMWKILDYPSVITALLSFKASYTPLPKGSLVIAIDDEKLRITLSDKKVLVTPDNGDPDFSFDSLSAVAALSSPVTSAFFSSHNNPDKLNLALRWFPLPLTCLRGERV